MTDKFTPGPWIIAPRSHWDKEIRISQDGDGWKRFACEVDYDDCDPETAEANARLIAAAPELLEKAVESSALLMRAAVALREADQEDLALDLEAHVFWNDAAIAKARGNPA